MPPAVLDSQITVTDHEQHDDEEKPFIVGFDELIDKLKNELATVEKLDPIPLPVEDI